MKRRTFIVATAGVVATAGCLTEDEDGDTQVGERTDTLFEARLAGESQYAKRVHLEHVGIIVGDGYAFVVEPAPDADTVADRAALRRRGNLIDSTGLDNDGDDFELIGDFPLYTGTFDLQFIKRHGDADQYREIVETVPIEVTKA